MSRNQLWEMLFELRDSGITIIVSTPYMDEAQKCDRVALMQEGAILTIDSPESIVDQYPGSLYQVRTSRMASLSEDLEALGDSASAHRFGDSVHFSIRDDKDILERTRRHLSGRNHSDIEIERIKPSIEDSFIKLMTGEGGPG